MFVYLLYVGSFNSVAAQLHSVYAEEYLAQNMGEQLRNGGACDYYYVQREPLIREFSY